MNSEKRGIAFGYKISTVQSAFLGVAGNAPSLSIGITSGVLIGSVGGMAPVAMLVCGFVIFGILFSYIRLNRENPNCGAAFAWATTIIHPVAGFFAGWCLVIASILAIISCALSAAQATLLLVGYPNPEDSLLIPIVAIAWVILTTTAAVRGMSLVGNLQSVLTAIEAILLLCFAIAIVYLHHDRLLDFSALSLDKIDTKFASEGFVLALFFYFGWDVIFNLSEETKNTQHSSSLAGIIAFSSLIVIFVFFSHAISVVLISSPPSPTDNALYALASHLFPEPIGHIAIVAFLLSALGAIETSTIQYSRTLYAQARDRALPPVFGQTSKIKAIPFISILVGAAAIVGMLLISAGATTFKAALNAGISATGVFVAFFYGFTGISCAKYFFRNRPQGIGSRLIYIYWPVISVAAMFTAAIVSITQFDALTTTTVLSGIGVGVAIMLFRRRYA